MIGVCYDSNDSYVAQMCVQGYVVMAMINMSITLHELRNQHCAKEEGGRHSEAKTEDFTTCTDYYLGLIDELGHKISQRNGENAGVEKFTPSTK